MYMPLFRRMRVASVLPMADRSRLGCGAVSQWLKRAPPARWAGKISSWRCRPMKALYLQRLDGEAGGCLTRGSLCMPLRSSERSCIWRVVPVILPSESAKGRHCTSTTSSKPEREYSVREKDFRSSFHASHMPDSSRPASDSGPCKVEMLRPTNSFLVYPTNSMNESDADRILCGLAAETLIKNPEHT